MQSTSLIIDGCEVTASFASAKNEEIMRHVKQILISSFVSSNRSSAKNRTFANRPEKVDNNRRDPLVP